MLNVKLKHSGNNRVFLVKAICSESSFCRGEFFNFFKQVSLF